MALVQIETKLVLKHYDGLLYYLDILIYIPVFYSFFSESEMHFYGEKFNRYIPISGRILILLFLLIQFLYGRLF